MRYISLTIIIILCCVVQQLSAQSSAIDSLQQLIETAKEDTTRIIAMRNLGVLLSDHDVPLAIEYVERARDLSEQKGYPDLVNYTINSLGIIYYGIGDYEKTLDCFIKVLAYQEKQNNVQGMSRIYNNLGLLFKELGRYDKSIDYLEKSVNLKLASGDSITLSSSYNNLGSVYQEGLKDYVRASDCYNRALLIDKRYGDTYGAFITLKNIGFNHFMNKAYDSAHYYYNEAVMLYNETDDRYIKSEFLYDFALLNAATGKLDRAIEKHNMSIEMAKTADIKLLLKKNYEGLADTYARLGDLKKALKYQKMCSEINNELFNADQNAKIAEIETNFQIQTKQNEIELLRKEAEIKDLKIKNNEMAFYWLGGVLLLVLLLGILQYRKNVYKTKVNKLLQLKNQEINDKNKNIMDSILYARNIQEAILAENDKLKLAFTDSFVFTKPRDVVNGDFYWFAEKGDCVIIAAVDCTGHGVPAAFLNVMGNSLLNQIVNEEDIIEPGQILKELNMRVFKSFKYDNMEVKADDGMDVGICLFDRSKMTLSFAGAKRPLYYFHNHALNVLKGDHYPVGGVLYEECRSYQQHEITLSKTDVIYLFTDGIVDQFGGENNKKFMYPRFRKLLENIAREPMKQQLTVIEESLANWQGDHEQTDDILLIGVRV